MLSGRSGEHFAHSGRSGEGDLANDRMGGQVAGNLGRVAEHQPDNPVRYARVNEGLHQCG